MLRLAFYDIADKTDDQRRSLASLVVDGQPLPAVVPQRLACNVTPMIFNGPSMPLWVGYD